MPLIVGKRSKFSILPVPLIVAGLDTVFWEIALNSIWPNMEHTQAKLLNIYKIYYLPEMFYRFQSFISEIFAKHFENILQRFLKCFS